MQAAANDQELGGGLPSRAAAPAAAARARSRPRRCGRWPRRTAAARSPRTSGPAPSYVDSEFMATCRSIMHPSTHLPRCAASRRRAASLHQFHTKRAVFSGRAVVASSSTRRSSSSQQPGLDVALSGAALCTGAQAAHLSRLVTLESPCAGGTGAAPAVARLPAQQRAARGRPHADDGVLAGRVELAARRIVRRAQQRQLRASAAHRLKKRLSGSRCAADVWSAA